MRFILALGTLAIVLAQGLPAPSLTDKPAGGVTITVETNHIDCLVGKERVARYHKGPSVAKPYFWPLNSPFGSPIPRGWPMVEAKKGESTDHPHQKSAWFCHGDVIPEGIEVKEKIR